MPQHAAITRIDSPGVVGGGEIENAFHRQYRSLDAGAAAEAARSLARTFPADDQRRPRIEAAPSAAKATPATGAVGDVRGPGQAQVLDVGLIDLGEAAITLTGVIARVSGPVIGQRLIEHRRIKRLSRQTQSQNGESEKGLHFTVTRKAVMSWMFLWL